MTICDDLSYRVFRPTPEQFLSLRGSVRAPNGRGSSQIATVAGMITSPSILFGGSIEVSRVLGIIAFGSAFRPLTDADMVWKRSGFLGLWGAPRIVAHSVEPKDRDFLAIIDRRVDGTVNACRAQQEVVEWRSDGYSRWPIYNDVHVIVRDVGTFLSANWSEDAVNATAVAQGVLIAAAPGLRDKIGPMRYEALTKREVRWREAGAETICEVT